MAAPGEDDGAVAGTFSTDALLGGDADADAGADADVGMLVDGGAGFQAIDVDAEQGMARGVGRRGEREEEEEEVRRAVKRGRTAEVVLEVPHEDDDDEDDGDEAQQDEEAAGEGAGAAARGRASVMLSNEVDAETAALAYDLPAPTRRVARKVYQEDDDDDEDEDDEDEEDDGDFHYDGSPGSEPTGSTDSGDDGDGDGDDDDEDDEDGVKSAHPTGDLTDGVTRDATELGTDQEAGSPWQQEKVSAAALELANQAEGGGARVVAAPLSPCLLR